MKSQEATKREKPRNSLSKEVAVSRILSAVTEAEKDLKITKIPKINQ